MYYFIQRPQINYYTIYDDKTHTKTYWANTFNEAINDRFKTCHYKHISNLLVTEKASILFKYKTLDEAMDEHPEYFI